MREDRFTTTPEDAGWFERHRSGGYGAADRPSLAEVLADADIDRLVERQRAREDDALRAAGRHVPTPRDRIAVSLSSIRFATANRADVEVTCVREGVFRFDHRHPLTAAQAAEVLSEEWEVVEHEGRLWGRVSADYLRDPWWDPLPDRPPF